MMILKTIASGSKGNCHALICDDEILLLDLGVSAREIKRGIDYRNSDIVGAVVSHEHKDHSKAAKEFLDMRKKVLTPYEHSFPNGFRYKSFNGNYLFGRFTIKPFDLTDKEKNWMHTNADGTDCPCYGFYIRHSDIGKILYITDTELVKWKFQDINHILISSNYQKKYLSDNKAKREHVLKGHMELETVKEFVKANKSPSLRNIILCHMSDYSCDADECVAEVQKVAGDGVYVDYAEKGKEWELSEFPF